MKLEQAFYGASDTGYKLLAISDSNQREKIEYICGLPVVNTVVIEENILFSIRDGELVFMCRMTKGPLDPGGRGSVLLHIFFANAREADSVGINAFTLSDAGYFCDEAPPEIMAADGKTPLNISSVRVDAPLTWDVRNNRLSAKGSTEILTSSKPAEEKVRAIVGNRVNAVSWATFTTKYLDGFACFAIPPEHKKAVESAAKKAKRTRKIPLFMFALGIALGIMIGVFVGKEISAAIFLTQLRHDELLKKRVDWSEMPRSLDFIMKGNANGDGHNEAAFLCNVENYVKFVNTKILNDEGEKK